MRAMDSSASANLPSSISDSANKIRDRSFALIDSSCNEASSSLLKLHLVNTLLMPHES